jgi:hypothetical protein
MDGVIGGDGELIRLSAEVRAAIKAADFRPRPNRHAKRRTIPPLRWTISNGPCPLFGFARTIAQPLANARGAARVDRLPPTPASWETLMICVPRSGAFLFIAIACVWGIGCQLRRPNSARLQMIEPQILDTHLSESASPVTKAPNAIPVLLR